MVPVRLLGVIKIKDTSEIITGNEGVGGRDGGWFGRGEVPRFGEKCLGLASTLKRIKFHHGHHVNEITQYTICCSNDKLK